MMIARRKFLGMGGGLAAASLTGASGAAWASSAPEPTSPRRVDLHNLHTGESVGVAYWENGAYAPDALSQVNKVLRDFRTGEVHDIHPDLLDLLHRLSMQFEGPRTFQVISAYRSPQTNAALARPGSGVAHHSLHMQGMAIDIRVPGIDLAALHRAALGLGAGGVGYYPASDFVHVDVGPVRQWAMLGHKSKSDSQQG